MSKAPVPAMRKLAVRRAAATVCESLEQRTMMSVSLNAIGATVITPGAA